VTGYPLIPEILHAAAGSGRTERYAFGAVRCRRSKKRTSPAGLAVTVDVARGRRLNTGPFLPRILVVAHLPAPVYDRLASFQSSAPGSAPELHLYVETCGRP